MNVKVTLLMMRTGVTWRRRRASPPAWLAESPEAAMERSLWLGCGLLVGSEGRVCPFNPAGAPYPGLRRGPAVWRALPAMGPRFENRGLAPADGLSCQARTCFNGSTVQ